MNGLIEFESHKIRFVGTQEEPEWVASDVCKAIGLSNVAMAMRSMGPTESGITTIDTAYGVQEVQTVKEPGLYRLVFKSKKPAAKRFFRFVTHEVLPSLNRHGCYPPPELTVQNQAIVRFDEEVFGRALGEQLRMVIHPISEDVQDLKKSVSNLDDKVDDLHHQFSKFQKRAEIDVDTKSLHCQVVYRMFGKRCPCCNAVEVVNSAGQPIKPLANYDHFLSRSDKRKSATWLICATCNQSLRDPEFHQTKREKFNVYQSMRANLEEIVAPTLPGFYDA